MLFFGPINLTAVAAVLDITPGSDLRNLLKTGLQPRF